MRKLLITGGTGFIGQHAIPKAVSAGFEVHVVSRSASIAKTLGAKHHRLDVFDRSAVQDKLNEIRPSHLLHLAWEVEHGRFWTSEQNLKWLQASIDLVQCFIHAGGKRFVGAGTCAEYDWSQCEAYYESAPIGPGTLYGSAKAALCLVLRQYCRQHGVGFAWGRIFNTYGPGEPSQKLISYILTKLMRNEEIVVSDLGRIRDFCHSKDVAKAFVLLLQSNISDCVNIGSGCPISIRDLIDIAGQVTSCSSSSLIVERPTPSSEPRTLIPDLARLMNEVGFKPEVPLESGLLELSGLFKASDGND
jgi:nucleoside-diphosphate-sugar epimerase